MRGTFPVICLISIAWLTAANATAQQGDSKDAPPNAALTRAQQIIALSSSREPDAAAKIKQALADESWYVRGEAARTVGRLGDKSASALLLPMLQDENWFVRFAALEAIGSPGASSGVPVLRETFSSSDEYMKAARAASYADRRKKPL